MPIDLYFPLLNDGVEQGLNDAGIETFEGEYQRHIVRECTQNALDARLGSQQVMVEVNLHQVPPAEIPGLAQLRQSISSAANYWREDEKTAAFCRKALEWTEGDNISILEVSDSGTTGLAGDDNNRRGSWFGLVRSGGVSIKPGDAAGAYGIGKNAPFAGSFIRTVFYSTLNSTGGRAFQGVTKLTTHLNAVGEKTQLAGFIGNVGEGPGCRAIRDELLIPVRFRRKQVGSSVFVVAYRHLGATDWTNEFIRESVENFWPAIHRGSLVFKIGDYRIDSTTLPALMSRYSGDPDFVSRYYYRAVANENRMECVISLPHLGSCRLFLVPGDATYPKKICMTRQTGMVIYEASRFRSYRPFAGLFICESSEGNSFLRNLEPPRHDKWDFKRADDTNEAKNALQNIRNWINQCLKDLNPDNDAREAEVPELNRYLPDEEDEPLADEAEVVTERGGTDGLLSAPISQPLPIHEIAPRPPTRQAEQGNDVPADGREDGEGEGDAQPDPDEEQTEEPGGTSETTGSGTTGEHRPHEVKISLQTRSVRSGPNSYDLIIRSATSCAGRLVIVSVGEDNKEDKDLIISSVLDQDNGNGVSLEDFVIDSSRPARLRISLESTVPVSLRAYCYGN